MQLYFDCYISPISVTPKNWDGKGANVKTDWCISYRFYDPSVTDDNGNITPLQVRIRGMNRAKTLEERRSLTKDLLNELTEILKEGWNPIKNKFLLPHELIKEVSRNTGFNQALTFALKHLEGAPKSIEQAGYKISDIKEGALKLKKDKKKIGEIELSDVMAIMKFLKEDLSWSNDNYNKHRSYLMMCFEVLKEWGAVKFNIIKETKKLKIVKKKREVLTDDEIIKVKEKLINEYYSFYRFMQIFHMSGARESEMINVKGKDVDLKNQFFKIILKKSGGDYEEVEKIITNAALPFWEEAMKECKPDDYVFGRSHKKNSCYKPSDKKLHDNRINKDWREFIMVPLSMF